MDYVRNFWCSMVIHHHKHHQSSERGEKKQMIEATVAVLSLAAYTIFVAVIAVKNNDKRSKK